MYRVLFECYGYPVKSYWVFYGLGMLIAACLGLWLARRRSIALWKTGVICFVSAMSAVVFGRVCSFCFEGSFEGFWDFRSGGQVSYGSMLGVLATVTLLAHSMRISLNDVLDAAVCVFPIGQAIQRIGCFCNGCCYGPLSNACLAVQFPKVVDAQGAVVGTPCFMDQVLSLIHI